MSAHIISALKSSTTVLAVTGSIDTDISRWSSGVPGEVYDRVMAVNQHKPAAMVNLKDVGAALTLCGVAGLTIDETAVELYTVGAADGAKFASTGEKWALNKGLMVPDRLRLADGEEAVISYKIFLGSDAGAAPYAVTSDQTVPATDLDNTWTLGAVTLNSVDIGPVKSVDIVWNWNVRVIHGDGSEWPQLVYGRKCQPEITIETLNQAAAVSVALVGTDNAVSITIQKNEANAARASSGHKTLTCSQQLVTVKGLAGEDEEAVTSIHVAPSSADGSAAPMAIA